MAAGRQPAFAGAKAQARNAKTRSTTNVVAADVGAVRTLVATPERGAMLAHLFWQHWRQSARLMFLIAGLQIGLALVILASGLEDGDVNAVFPLVIMAGLGGSCVFLADQERRHYRYFTEHNVPPRAVWFTRQVQWIAILAVSTMVTGFFWIGPRTIAQLFNLVESATNLERYWSWNWNQFDYVPIPQVWLGLACVAVSYAAGQWTSMMIRSGLLAGFFGLVLAGVLCGWVFLMFLLEVSWLWTVVPIPLVLLWATWLRAVRIGFAKTRPGRRGSRWRGRGGAGPVSIDRGARVSSSERAAGRAGF